MDLHSLLTPARTLCGQQASGKRAALELLARAIAADIGVDAEDLLRRFLARERLGSTGVGHGIAIPHSRFDKSQNAIGALITLSQPVDFDSIDGEPVDILFAMLVPEAAHDEHLKNLAALASALNNAALRQRLRDATSHQALFDAVAG
jgi:PTS system nitrogen regulatory IIA component